MSRLIGPSVAAALAFASAPAAAEPGFIADPACRVVRILPSGRRLVTPPTERPGRPPSSVGASAASSSSSSSASGVSVASRSSGRGSHASASASTSTGRRGRTVTTTHDDNGCTVVIDDRPGQGARR